MNKQAGTGLIGIALMIAAFMFMIVAFATIEPFKQALDDARDTTSLNCRGTTNFNQTAYDEDEDSVVAKLTRRPTCFITGMSLVYFIGAFLIATIAWVVRNWRKIG